MCNKAASQKILGAVTTKEFILMFSAFSYSDIHKVTFNSPRSGNQPQPWICIRFYPAPVTGTKEIIQLIQKSTKETVDKALARGIRKTVKVMVLGVPNVGKSTLINALRGKGIAQTGDRPGVTKSNQWIRISPYLELLDTPGMLWPRLDDQQAAKRLCYIGSVKDDITDLYLLALSLMEEMMETCLEKVMDRFHIEDESLRGQELMEAACRGRGWLLKGGEFDYDRASRVILDEFRGGKLGRITLEKVPDLMTVKSTEKESSEIHQNAGEGSNAPDENEQNEKQEGVSDCHSETVKEVNP